MVKGEKPGSVRGPSLLNVIAGEQPRGYDSALKESETSDCERGVGSELKVPFFLSSVAISRRPYRCFPDTGGRTVRGEKERKRATPCEQRHAAPYNATAPFGSACFGAT